jgi:hypothetical protein
MNSTQRVIGCQDFAPLEPNSINCVGHPDSTFVFESGKSDSKK